MCPVNLLSCDFTRSICFTPLLQTPLIISHLQNYINVSCCVGELAFTYEPVAPSAKLHICVRDLKSQWHILVHGAVTRTNTHQMECWFDSWVSRNVWGKHLSQSSNRIVPRWRRDATTQLWASWTVLNSLILSIISAGVVFFFLSLSLSVLHANLHHQY